MALQLRQVEAFKIFVETGTVVTAAQRMGVSQPAVSKLLAALERAVGFPLFVRGQRRLNLTAEARILYLEIERSFAGLGRIEAAAREIKALGAGHLVVGSMPALSLRFMPELIAAFVSARPNVQVRFLSFSTPRINELLETQQIELGIVLHPGERPGVHVDLLCKAEFVCIVPPGHALAAKATIGPADLRGERLITLAESDPNRQTFERILQAERVSLRNAIETTTATAICGFVAQGAGVALVNPFAARDCRTFGLVARQFRPKLEIELGLGRPAFMATATLARDFASLLHERARAVVDEVAGGALFGD